MFRERQVGRHALVQDVQRKLPLEGTCTGGDCRAEGHLIRLHRPSPHLLQSSQRAVQLSRLAAAMQHGGAVHHVQLEAAAPAKPLASPPQRAPLQTALRKYPVAARCTCFRGGGSTPQKPPSAPLFMRSKCSPFCWISTWLIRAAC